MANAQHNREGAVASTKWKSFCKLSSLDVTSANTHLSLRAQGVFSHLSFRSLARPVISVGPFSFSLVPDFPSLQPPTGHVVNQIPVCCAPQRKLNACNISTQTAYGLCCTSRGAACTTARCNDQLFAARWPFQATRTATTAAAAGRCFCRTGRPSHRGTS